MVWGVGPGAGEGTPLERDLYCQHGRHRHVPPPPIRSRPRNSPGMETSSSVSVHSSIRSVSVHSSISVSVHSSIWALSRQSRRMCTAPPTMVEQGRRERLRSLDTSCPHARKIPRSLPSESYRVGGLCPRVVSVWGGDWPEFLAAFQA